MHEDVIIGKLRVEFEQLLREGQALGRGSSRESVRCERQRQKCTRLHGVVHPVLFREGARARVPAQARLREQLAALSGSTREGGMARGWGSFYTWSGAMSGSRACAAQRRARVRMEARAHSSRKYGAALRRVISGAEFDGLQQTRAI